MFGVKASDDNECSSLLWCLDLSDFVSFTGDEAYKISLSR